MKRRPRAGGKPVKTRRLKAATAKRRVAPKPERRSGSTAAGPSDQIARLTRERDEALARELATGEILASISGSMTDARPIFDAIVLNLLRLFGTRFAIVVLLRDGMIEMEGFVGEAGFEKFAALFPVPLDEQTMVGKTILAGEATQFTPVIGHPKGSPFIERSARRFGFNSFIGAPMIRDGKTIGAIATAHRDAVPFTDKQIALIKSFAAQAVIAIENVRLLNELRQALQQQTATADVLKVISRSAFDLQTVLDTLTESAARLCRAERSAIRLARDGLYHNVASHGFTPEHKERMEREPVEPGPDSIVGRVALAGKSIHVLDAQLDPNPVVANRSRSGKVRTMLAVPLLREGTPIGVLLLQRGIVQPFTDQEIALAETFADQAVIAIENVRLFDQVQARTRDVQEALARQTAMSDILRVISQSPTDVQPVFDSIVLTAARLLRCDLVFVLRCDGATFSSAAAASPEGPLADIGPKNLPIDRSANFPSRAILDKKMLHLPDWSLIDLPEHERNIHKMFGLNSALFLPLLREGDCIGLLVLAGKRPNLFGAVEIAQAESFRDQALIAIENTRLFNELRQRTADLGESLAQQTATSEVLSVISSSPGELDPVFKTILENATRICGAEFGHLFRYEDGVFRAVAMHNTPSAFDQFLKEGPVIPAPGTGLARIVSDPHTTHILDVTKLEAYANRDPFVVAGAERGHVRTLLIVPMLKDGALIGVIAIFRQEVRAFTEKQIALVTSFAAQAVIAIENTRLLSELRQSLEQQTATADVLRVISSSPGELEPVFQACSRMQRAFARRNSALCGSAKIAVSGWSRPRALPPAYSEKVLTGTVVQPGPTLPVARAASTRQPVHIADLREDPSYLAGEPVARTGVDSATFAPWWLCRC